MINRSGTDRYSVPFFFDGGSDFVLTPLDGSAPPGAKALTVDEHVSSDDGVLRVGLMIVSQMRERFSTTYGRGKEREDGKRNVVV